MAKPLDNLTLDLYVKPFNILPISLQRNLKQQLIRPLLIEKRTHQHNQNLDKWANLNYISQKHLSALRNTSMTNW